MCISLFIAPVIIFLQNSGIASSDTVFPIMLWTRSLRSGAVLAGAPSSRCSPLRVWRGWRVQGGSTHSSGSLCCLSGAPQSSPYGPSTKSTDQNHSKAQPGIKELEKQTPPPDGRSSNITLQSGVDMAMLSSLEAQRIPSPVQGILFGSFHCAFQGPLPVLVEYFTKEVGQIIGRGNRRQRAGAMAVIEELFFVCFKSKSFFF